MRWNLKEAALLKVRNIVCDENNNAKRKMIMGKIRKPGGGRKLSKPNYDAGKILQEQMDATVVLYNSGQSLQAIAETLELNPIKVRKLLITAGVYESDIADQVQHTFYTYRVTQSYKDAVLSTAESLKLSKSSVSSYLSYEKGIYFPAKESVEKVSVGAERQRRYRIVKRLRDNPTEQHLGENVLAYAGVRLKIYSGLQFTY